ncbi:hypothetical protein BDC45DRAFT_541124 [Circinella umbellata]|nr:hypothetical protein BDC45DRAFT_541124 [Circinella umbellata]
MRCSINDIWPLFDGWKTILLLACLLRGLYSLNTRHGIDVDLNQVTKTFLKEVYTYCNKKAFQKKIIRKASDALKENEEYLYNIRRKEAKKRTPQQAELLGVNMTHRSSKQYRSEILTDVSNARQQREQATSSSSAETRVSSTQHELNEPSAKSILMKKNQKSFILNSASFCLSTPHKPKIQKVDTRTIANLCSLGIEYLENDDEYKNTETMQE